MQSNDPKWSQSNSMAKKVDSGEILLYVIANTVKKKKKKGLNLGRLCVIPVFMCDPAEFHCVHCVKGHFIKCSMGLCSAPLSHRHSVALMCKANDTNSGSYS